ncbi:8536_t:CDS:10, partial [Cetraspora pellucida]
AKGPNWTCLDGSATIPYEAINDDFCDCADGSDEPGTSACSNGKFYCRNEGHIPSSIPSSRINDGVCDEYDGKIKCPNTCKEASIEYNKKLDALKKLRTQGIRIRNSYIEEGKKLRIKREAELNRLKIELEAAKIRVREREAALKKIETRKTDTEQSGSKVNRERIKKYQKRISSLKENINRLHEKVDTLLSILKDMKNNHNQNYHDMAVKTAIKAYDEFLEEYTKSKEAESGDEDEDGDNSVVDEKDEPQTREQKPSYWEQFSEMLWEIKNGVLELFGLQSYDKNNRSYSSYRTSKELSATRSAFEEAEQEQKDIEDSIDEINSKLSLNYGLKDEFATLDDECFNYDSGEYTYTLCMFGSATQKSNKDHTSTDLGNFEKWIGAESKDDPQHYTQMLYANGANCWNGPARSVKVYLECGADNEILSVSEPEKCEYHLKMLTPAVCFDLENNSSGINHDE